jgi:hypothetical protein
VYFNFKKKIITQIEIKTYNIDEKKSGEYRSELDQSKNTFSVRNSCNSNNDDFKEMTE